MCVEAPTEEDAVVSPTPPSGTGIAERLGLCISGGSDFHGDASHGAPSPGSTALPEHAFNQLRDRATSRAIASGATTSS